VFVDGDERFIDLVAASLRSGKSLFIRSIRSILVAVILLRFQFRLNDD
jgi:hypothetical protein